MRRIAVAVLPFALACAGAQVPPSGGAGQAVEEICSRAELQRRAGHQVSALLASPAAAARARAAIAAGRVADVEAVPALVALLSEREGLAASPDAPVAATAAWALGRIAGGEEALVACLRAGCPAAAASARALGTGMRGPGVYAALAAALAGAPGVAAEAGTALGILARIGGNAAPAQVAEAAGAQLVAALGRPEAAVRSGAAYALGRIAPLAALAPALSAAPGRSAAPVGHAASAASVVSPAPVAPAAPAARGADAGREGAAESLAAPLRAGLAAALRDSDPLLRALAARAWGKQALEPEALAAALGDDEVGVRVEAARGLALAAGAAPSLAPRSAAVLAAAIPRAVAAAAGPAVADARWAHALVALLEAAAQAGVPLEALPLPAALKAPSSGAIVAVRCAAAEARDRVRGALLDTPTCGANLEEEWRSRRRSGALATSLASAGHGQVAPPAAGAAPAPGAPASGTASAAVRAAALRAFADVDGRVRAAAAGEAGAAFAPELRHLLDDADPFVVAAAAAALGRDASSAAAALDDAVRAARRLSDAKGKGAGDPAADALASLAELLGAAGSSADPGDPRRAAATQALMALTPSTSPYLHRSVVAALRKLGAAAAAAALPAPAPTVPAEAARGLPGKGPRPRLLSLLTSAGELRIELRARDGEAPLTAAAVAALAQRGFYDGLSWHRVVPDFVVQGGDPRGDGDGGPGWALPDEHTPLRFLRGTVGIATNGPETGGSQLFLCLSPQPHLDGRYTIVGELRGGDDVLDALQMGDEILSATVE